MLLGRELQLRIHCCGNLSAGRGVNSPGEFPLRWKTGPGHKDHLSTGAGTVQNANG